MCLLGGANEEAHLGYVKDAKHIILTELGKKADGNGPHLLFWEAGADSHTVSEYDGVLKFNALIDWLESAIAGDIRAVKEKRGPEELSSTSSSSSVTAPSETEDPAARRARLQAKMDEIERRDRIRREKAAAKKAAEDEAAGGTPVEDAPPAEPEEAAEDEEAEQTEGITHTHPVGRNAAVEPSDDGTPVEDAPPAEPAEAAEDETATEAADWDSWPESSTEAGEHARDEL